MHHGAGLREILTKDGMEREVSDEFIEALAQEVPDHALLSSADRALLAYARKLTLNPWAIEAVDIDSLRAEGLDDHAIHDACAVVSYFAFVNRIADGLGVELENRWSPREEP